MGLHRVRVVDLDEEMPHKKCSGLYTFSGDLTRAPAAGFGTSRPVLAGMYGAFSRPQCTQLCTGQGSTIDSPAHAI
jgi:hypothetical protein